jgi:hypothetical protein
MGVWACLSCKRRIASHAAGELLPRNVRVFHFGSEPQNWSQLSGPPSATTMLQGVCADPPSLIDETMKRLPGRQRMARRPMDKLPAASLL